MSTEAPSTWLDLAIAEELERLVKQFEFKDEAQATQAEALAKVFNKALETWDGDGDFGVHASIIFLVLGANPGLREKMGIVSPNTGG